MRKLSSMLLAVVFSWCFGAHAAVPLEQLLYKGKGVPFYSDANTPDQQKFIAGMRSAGLAELMASLVSNSLMIKSDIGIGFESCGQPNAFFDPKRRSIIMCSEFIELMTKTAYNDKEMMGKLPGDQVGRVIYGLVWGIFFHELAHALIFTNNIPITGREEDVADQFAVWYAINFVDLKQTPVLSPTIWFWRQLSKARDIPAMSDRERRAMMSNEHSLDEQRVYNIGCWALGVGTEAGVKTAQFAGLPEERAQRCQGEYSRMDQGMRNHFKKYFKVRPLSGAW